VGKSLPKDRLKWNSAFVILGAPLDILSLSPALRTGAARISLFRIRRRGYKGEDLS
jgi:hypothetical protein